MYSDDIDIIMKTAPKTDTDFSIRRIIDDLPIPNYFADFGEERQGLINKILKLKEEIKRLRNDYQNQIP